ncbi:hypothetical protein [Archaeoglobus sulfaticallidus]|uniref:hypothetical protein n=1 Tax=Archaeoglobus sulfaticallidus TaxID=1316941 RepID=UPI00064FA363|nr:hypothetical protein [Archaeoglobus sulfaticallidus]
MENPASSGDSVWLIHHCRKGTALLSAGCQIDYTSLKFIQKESQNFYAIVKNANKNKNQDWWMLPDQFKPVLAETELRR